MVHMLHRAPTEDNESPSSSASSSSSSLLTSSSAPSSTNTTPAPSPPSSTEEKTSSSAAPVCDDRKEPSIERRLIVIEEGCAEIQTRAIDVIQNYLINNDAKTKHYSRRRPRLFTAAEYVSVYNIVYDMCTHYRVNASAELYQQYNETVEKYLTNHSVPAIQKQHAPLQSHESSRYSCLNDIEPQQPEDANIQQIVSFLEEVKHQWFDCLLLTKWLHKFVSYVEKYWTRQVNVPNLYDVSFSLFGQIVYEKYGKEMAEGLLDLIEMERNGQLTIGMKGKEEENHCTRKGDKLNKMVIEDTNGEQEEEKMDVDSSDDDEMVVVDAILFTDLIGLYLDMGVVASSDCDDNIRANGSNSGGSAGGGSNGSFVRFRAQQQRHRGNRPSLIRQRSSLSLSNLSISSSSSTSSSTSSSSSTSQKTEPLSAYEEDFEQPFLETSRRYYATRRDEWVRKCAKTNDDVEAMLCDEDDVQCDVICLGSDFLEWAYDAMVKEDNRLDYLTPQTCTKLLDLFVEEVFDEDVQYALVGSGEGQQTRSCLLDILFQDWDIDGLHKIYLLACKMKKTDDGDGSEETDDDNKSDGLDRLKERFRHYLMKSSLCIRHKERKYMDIFHNKCIIMLQISFEGNAMLLNTFLEYYVGFETCEEMSGLVMEYV